MTLLGVSLPTLAAEASKEVAAKLKAIPACPALISAANLNQIPIEGFDASAGTNALHSGDSATVLVTFVQRKKQTQWLLYFEAANPDPAKATNKPATFTVSSALGPPIKFKSRPYPVKLRMFGPFAPSSTRQPISKETTAQFSVNEDFLALGMEQAAALLYRWSKTTNFSKDMSFKALRAMNPTPEEQRALSSVFPALISYFEIVQHTEGLEDLLKKLIELPSLWSIIRHRGVEMTIAFDGAPSPAEPANWNLEPAAPAYHFPWLIQLNEQRALNLTLITTRPDPPWLIAGGVAGLLAEKIDDAETYMTMRVIRAKSAKNKTAD